jgi:hypothetical protein
MKIKSIYIQTLICAAFVSFTIGCSKSGGGGTTPAPTPPTVPTEETIAFAIDIDPGSTVYAAMGATQDAKITLSSKMPTAGIGVDVVVKKDADNSIVSSGSYSSLTSPFTATISNLSPGVLCTATFTVTSKTTTSNSSVKSFKMARK